LLVELAARDLEDLPADANWLPAVVAMAETCAVVGDAVRGALVYRTLLPHARTNVVSGTTAVLMGPVTRSLRPLALPTDDAPAAMVHLETAVADATRMGARAVVAAAELELARVLEARDETGDRERATALRAGALETARRLGWAALLPARDASRPPEPVAADAPRIRHATLRREGDFWTLACG